MKLAIERWGQGRPLLLLHGFTGNRSAWEGVRPHLEGRLQGVVVDLPGHGESPLPLGRGREGFEATVDALGTLLGELSPGGAPGEVDVLGYSQGARLALALALKFPSRVRRVVLESGSPGLRRRRARSMRRSQDEGLARRIEASGVEHFAEWWERLPIFGGLERLAPGVAEALRARRRSLSASGLAGALRALGLGTQPNLWPYLHTLRAPVLLITGSRDRKFTEIARRMAAELPLAWRCSLDAYHAPHLERPLEYAREVATFLELSWGDEWHPGPTAAATSETRVETRGSKR